MQNEMIATERVTILPVILTLTEIRFILIPVSYDIIHVHMSSIGMYKSVSIELEVGGGGDL